MATCLTLEKYTMGVGDRFARQAPAQLEACLLAARQGVSVIPVWNKSNREHLTIGSEPASTRAAADAAAKDAGWTAHYYVDADHIRLDTVDRFVASSDFFTIDVADSIGKAAAPADVEAFCARHPEFIGRLVIPGIDDSFHPGRGEIERIVGKYLLAIQEAGKIFRHILRAKGEGQFITEVSMDETDCSQTPLELLVILAGLADEKVPLQTIAPKFSGRFNKGVDYVGNVARFEQEFHQDLAVIAFAIKQYGLPLSLKLSVHSGSDKFSIYGPIRRALARFDAGLHLKTAGTTWLEEVIGLAESGGSGLAMAKEIYAGALEHMEELCVPYATVVDIDPKRLPAASVVSAWSAAQFVTALRHDPMNPGFNPHLRQLLHVGYKIAAKMGPRYLEALQACKASVTRNVTTNLFERHIRPLFLGNT